MSRYRFLAPLLLLPLLTGCSEPNTAKLPPPPRDEFLISHFHQNRRSFTRVVEIAKGCMQPTGAYSFDRDDPARAMTPILTPFFLSCDADEERHPEAARIVKELGVMSVVGNEHAVSFLASRFSAHHGDPLDTFGFEKGWEFIPDGADSPDSSVVVGSLDEVDINTEPSGIRCRTLGDGWYIYLKWWTSSYNYD